MIPRKIKPALNQLLDGNPAVVLIGPRQVGKTTLAREVADERDALYLDLERPSDLAKTADIEQYCAENANHLLVLDEVHRAPGLFAPLRAIIDEHAGKRSGLFLLLGSASIDLLQQSSETLVACCWYARVSGLRRSCCSARPPCRDGRRPGRAQASSAERARSPGRFWTMLAHNQGQTHNAAALARGLDVSGVTIARYLDLLADLLLIRRLPPWTSNVGRRLVKAKASRWQRTSAPLTLPAILQLLAQSR